MESLNRGARQPLARFRRAAANHSARPSAGRRLRTPTRCVSRAARKAAAHLCSRQSRATHESSPQRSRGDYAFSDDLAAGHGAAAATGREGHGTRKTAGTADEKQSWPAISLGLHNFVDVSGKLDALVTGG